MSDIEKLLRQQSATEFWIIHLYGLLVERGIIAAEDISELLLALKNRDPLDADTTLSIDEYEKRHMRQLTYVLKIGEGILGRIQK